MFRVSQNTHQIPFGFSSKLVEHRTQRGPCDIQDISCHEVFFCPIFDKINCIKIKKRFELLK